MERSRTIEELVEKLKTQPRQAFDYLEVKQLAEILSRHRAKARSAIKEYRDLKRAVSLESDPIERLYLNYEGMFLRDHLRDALRLYVMVNHDFHEAQGCYMKALKAENSAPETLQETATIVKKIIVSNGVTKMSQGRLKRA